LIRTRFSRAEYSMTVSRSSRASRPESRLQPGVQAGIQKSCGYGSNGTLEISFRRHGSERYPSAAGPFNSGEEDRVHDRDAKDCGFRIADLESTNPEPALQSAIRNPQFPVGGFIF
jgi:hypothetical protein